MTNVSKGTFILLATLLLSACSGTYHGLPRAEMLAYQTYRTHGSLHALALAQAQAINDAVEADTLHPGQYADYGVALALMGHKSAACRMLNAEIKAFPESRSLVYRIKQRLMPDLLLDTAATARDTAHLAQLAGWAYDSLTALLPLPSVPAVIDSTDTLFLQMQTPVDSVEIPIRLTANQKRQLLEEQQARDALRKQAQLDSIAAAKQAKIDARRQAQLDREKAKKEKEQAREQARKEAQKERERQRKEKKKKQ
ncbi:MAG: DUF4810 domain-containing protein [Bacteroidales bacterium]|nr:DUF4810 domain-containing protein [Bacteroidales bacterium]MDY6370710.1 DUF4810 domain-containing protein [Bacteroidales bacterium]